MTTLHQSEISYITFSQLWKVISCDEIWPVLGVYFPPRENTTARIAEVQAIRNRVAHFREPHIHDLDRLTLFLKDMEPGIRRFCNRYTNDTNVPQDLSADPVLKFLAHNWEKIGYGIELHHPHGWLYAPEPYKMRPKMNARLGLLYNKSYVCGSPIGMIYRLTVRCGNDDARRLVDTETIFNCTRCIHEDIIHIILSICGDELSFTIPAVIGPERVTAAIEVILRSALNAAGNYVQPPECSNIDWPEFVLRQAHILTLDYEEISRSQVIII